MISPACVMNQMHAGMHKAAQGHEQKAGLLHPRFRSMQRRAVSRAGRPYTKAFGTKEMSLSIRVVSCVRECRFWSVVKKGTKLPRRVARCLALPAALRSSRDLPSKLPSSLAVVALLSSRSSVVACREVVTWGYT